VEETFALGNRGRGKVFCLQILHSYAPPWHITRRGLVVLEMTLPLAVLHGALAAKAQLRDEL
jgi:hypothetical protein